MSRLTIINGNVFDSIKGVLLSNHSIVIENKKISWIGDHSNFEPQSEDKVIDATNKFVLPGLMDIHIHLSVDFSWTIQPERFEKRRKSSMIAYLALKHAQTYLKYGFTTIRDCGDWLGNWGAPLRRVFEQKIFPGPRLFVAQRPMRQWGNQEAFGSDDNIEIDRKYEILSGEDGVIHAVRERKRMGSDFIKTMTTGGVLHGMESKVERSLWRDEELRAMVSEAERLGMYVAAHAHGELGVQKAVENGVRTIEHGSLISEETADLMVKKGTFLVPTHSAQDLIRNSDVRKSLPPEVLKKGEYVSELAIQRHKIAFQKGVIFALGTDAPVGENHCHSGREIQKMVEVVGMTPEQALQSATINAAQAIQHGDLLGSLEVGKLADIIIVEGDPTKDISILLQKENMISVIKDGAVIAQKGMILN